VHPVTLDGHFAELATLTGRPADKWRDILTLPPVARAQALLDYKDDVWVQSPTIWPQVINIVTIIGTFAGAISGLAGAAGAVAALKTL
jgi:hypothetical protein